MEKRFVTYIKHSKLTIFFQFVVLREPVANQIKYLSK